MDCVDLIHSEVYCPFLQSLFSFLLQSVSSPISLYLSSFYQPFLRLLHFPSTSISFPLFSFPFISILFIFFTITFRQGIEDAIVNRRREEYEEKVALNPYDYDAWFDYLRLEETEGMDHEKTRGWIY